MAVEENIFAVVGEVGFAGLVAEFYRRVKTDALLGPLYPPNDFENAEQRLRDFLIQRFGGPGKYSAERGHPRLRMRHAPFPVDLAARNRWVELMEQALADAAFAPEIDSTLRKYFHDTATFMINASATSSGTQSPNPS
jgi:hemoglobin